MPWAGSARCVRPCLGPEADRRRGAPDPRHGPARLSPRLRRLLRRRRPGRPPGAASGTAVPPPHRRVSLCGRCASPCGRWVRASVSRHTAATPPPHRRDAALPRHRRIRRPGGGAPLRGRVVPPLAASRRSLVATVRRWPWRPWGRQGAAGRLVRAPWTAFAIRVAPLRCLGRVARAGPVLAPRRRHRISRLRPAPCASPRGGDPHGPRMPWTNGFRATARLRPLRRDGRHRAASQLGATPPFAPWSRRLHVVRPRPLRRDGAIEPPPPRRTPSAFSVGDLPQDPALAPPSRPRRFPSAASRRLGRLSPVPPGPLLRRMG